MTETSTFYKSELVFTAGFNWLPLFNVYRSE